MRGRDPYRQNIMSLSQDLKVAIDEARMQMLGAQVLFGFQLRGAFEEGFEHLSTLARIVDVVALASIVLTATVLVAAPAQHRIVEQGDASVRLLRLTEGLGLVALMFFALTLGCDGYIVSEYYFGSAIAAFAGVTTLAVATLVWWGLGKYFEKRRPRSAGVMRSPMKEETALHEKIVQMLTEARVVLPGVQGIFGFQLVVTMTRPFDELPLYVKGIHFVAMALLALSIVLLIAPTAIHRLSFKGQDSSAFLVIGARLISIALAPLMAGIGADFYVAAGKMIGFGEAALFAAVSIFLILLTAWYIAPWIIRARILPRSPG